MQIGTSENMSKILTSARHFEGCPDRRDKEDRLQQLMIEHHRNRSDMDK